MLEEPKVIPMLPGTTERWARHDVRGGVKDAASSEHVIENARVAFELKSLPRRMAKSMLDLLPRLNAIKELEENRSEENLFRPLVTLIENTANEVLAHAIRGTVHVREPVLCKHGIIRPRWWRAHNPPHEEVLARGSESPVSVKHRRSSQYSA
jgi:hypothetical protein